MCVWSSLQGQVLRVRGLKTRRTIMRIKAWTGLMLMFALLGWAAIGCGTKPEQPGETPGGPGPGMKQTNEPAPPPPPPSGEMTGAPGSPAPGGPGMASPGAPGGPGGPGGPG